MKSEELLSRTESAALRGLAILGIVLHNYCHFLSFAIKENEYTFTADRPVAFWEKLSAFDTDLFVHFFSFLGHYGVPVFLFVSGFGLVMKYEKQTSSKSSQLSVPSFMTYHYLKLFRLMIIGFVTFILVYISRHDDGATVYSFDHILTQLSMTINFFYFSPDRIIKPGPYWYFGLMLQIYLLYVLIIRRWRSPWLLVALVFVVSFVQMVFHEQSDWLNYIRYNFIGAVMPFALGIAYARWGRQLSRWGCFAVLFVSLTGVLMGSLWFHSWLWVPLFVVTGAVATVKLLPSFALDWSAWVGSISAMLFVMHPIAREIVISHYRKIDIYYGILIYLCTSIALAMLLRYVLKYIPKPKLKS